MSISKFNLLLPADLTPEVKKNIIEVGLSSGIWSAQAGDIEYYSEQLVNAENIHIVAEDDSGRFVGYILGRIHNSIVPEYKELDPLIAKSEIPMIYVDHVNVNRDLLGNSFGVGMGLILALIRESNKRGFFRFSLHCRVQNGLSRVIQKKFNADTVRRIENYRDCKNEPFDYLEGNVNLL